MREGFELAQAFDAAAERWVALERADGWDAVWLDVGWHRYVLTQVHHHVRRVPLGKIEQMGDGPALEAFHEIGRLFQRHCMKPAQPLPAGAERAA